MRKVKAGSVNVIKRGRAKRHDQYLIDCVKAVTNTTDVMVTECRISNTVVDKGRIRARIARAQGSTELSIQFHLDKGKLIPVLSKKRTK